MNIFEYLGLPKDHRNLANKVTQLVKHYDEVVQSNKDGKVYAVQVKKDGVCSITIVLDDKVSIWSRTGKRFTNTEDLVRRIRKKELPNGVYLGEMWCPKSIASLEEVSGAVNPNRNKPLSSGNANIPKQLRMSFFDLVSLDGFKFGHFDITYEKRWRVLKTRNSNKINEGDGIEVLDYSLIREDQQDMLDHVLSTTVDLGEEGIVIRVANEFWVAGHKGYRVMKKVRGVDYDLTCIGYEEGTGKYKGLVANLIFNWKDGKTIKAMLGKGWTHEMAKEMFDTLNYGNSVGMPEHAHKDSPIGKVFQVYALEESSKGKLRLPKVGERRFDKEVSDV